MKSTPDVLSINQRRAIPFLLQAPTQGEAAKAAGVSRWTLQRWLRMPAFVEALRSAEDKLVAAAANRLIGLGQEETWLDTLLFYDLNSHERRITKLEQRLDQIINKVPIA